MDPHERIAAAIDRSGLTGVEISKRLEVSPQWVSAVKSGKFNPGKKYPALAALVGVDERWLVHGDSTHAPPWVCESLDRVATAEGVTYSIAKDLPARPGTIAQELRTIYGRLERMELTLGLMMKAHDCDRWRCMGCGHEMRVTGPTVTVRCPACGSMWDRDQTTPAGWKKRP
jgi:predicted RNA-binding Zn-ribbon protein involved in translation (DUF1610 family)